MSKDEHPSLIPILPALNNPPQAKIAEDNHESLERIRAQSSPERDWSLRASQ
jgi:hypothetical protein